MDNEFMNDYRKQNKKNNAMIIIFILIIVTIMLYLSGKILINKFDSKLIFANFFNDIFEKVNDNISVYCDKFENSNIQMENNITLSFDDDYLDEMELDNIGLNMITQLDIDNNNLFIDYKYLENKEELLNFQVSYTNQNFYLLFYELFERVLKITYEDEEKVELDKKIDTLIEQVDKGLNINSSDVERFLKLTREIVANNIDENSFFKSKEKVTIESVEYNLEKHAYVLEGKDYNNFIINILTDIKENDEYINLLVKLFDLDKDCLLNKLDEIIEEHKDNLDNVREEYIIYTKGLFREVVGFGINSINNDEQSNFRIKYFNIDDSYKFLIEDEYDSFSEDDNYYVFEGKKLDDIVKLTYKENGELCANITYKSVGNSMEIVIANPDTEDAIKIYLFSLVEEKIVTSNVSLEYTDGESIIKLDIDNKISTIDDILKLEYDNAIEINDLTEDDSLKMQDNMENIFEKSKLFSSLFGYTNESSVDESL